MSVPTNRMRGRYWISVSAFLFDSPSWRVSWGWVVPLVLEALGVDTAFPYRVPIVDRVSDCRTPVCRPRFRFLEVRHPPPILSASPWTQETRGGCGWPKFVSEKLWGKLFGTGKRRHYERGFFNGGISRISKISKFSKSLENGRILLYFPQSGGSLEYLESQNSLESRDTRKWTFLKWPLSKRPLFSEPELHGPGKPWRP